MTDVTAAESRPLSTADAVNLLLQQDAAPAQPDEAPQETDIETEVTDDADEAVELELDAEQSDDVEVDDSEDDETPTEVVYTVKVDGQEVEVTEAELLNGYQRQADYTRKSQALAQARKAHEAEVSEARQLRDQYAAALHQVEQLFQPQDPGEQYWSQLYESDPLEYVRTRDQFRSRQEAFQKVVSERQQLTERQQADLAQQRQQHLAQQREEMLRRIPAWQDDATFEKERSALKAWANAGGISDEEIAGVADARAVEIMRKAYLYDQLMSDQSVAKKKVKAAPRVTRPGQPRAKGESAAKRKQAALQKLSRTGKLNDAVDYLLS